MRPQKTRMWCHDAVMSKNKKGRLTDGERSEKQSKEDGQKDI